MARKSLPNPSGTPSSSNSKTPSTISSRNRAAKNAARGIRDSQYTLTQINFAPETEFIVDSEGEDDEHQGRPLTKRRRKLGPKEELKKQTTLTQMDFVSYLGRFDISDISDDEVEPEAEPVAKEYADEPNSRIVPNSSSQPPIDDPPRIEQYEEQPAQFQNEGPATAPSTPKRVRLLPVPSSQTPSATPISIRGSSPRKESSRSEVPPPTSPTPKSRALDPLVSPLQQALNPGFSFQTQVQTQTQTSPSTKRRIVDFNKKWVRISREKSFEKRALQTDDHHTNISPTERSNDQLTSPETRANREEELDEAEFSIGEETQAALLHKRRGSWLSDSQGTTNDDSEVLDHTEGSVHTISGGRSFEIPVFEDESEGQAELVSSNENYHDSLKRVASPPPVPNQDMDGQQQQTSPIHPSQASTVPCTPQIWQPPLLLAVPEGSTAQSHSYTALDIFVQNTNGEIHTPQVSVGGESQFSPPVGSLPKGGLITISQLIPSSLIGSDLPLPPSWSQRDDDWDL
jgi:hypothetical protein